MPPQKMTKQKFTMALIFQDKIEPYHYNNSCFVTWLGKIRPEYFDEKNQNINNISNFLFLLSNQRLY